MRVSPSHPSRRLVDHAKDSLDIMSLQCIKWVFTERPGRPDVAKEWLSSFKRKFYRRATILKPVGKNPTMVIKEVVIRLNLRRAEHQSYQ